MEFVLFCRRNSSLANTLLEGDRATTQCAGADLYFDVLHQVCEESPGRVTVSGQVHLSEDRVMPHAVERLLYIYGGKVCVSVGVFIV